MKKIFYVILIVFFSAFFSPNIVTAENSFYPEADDSLAEENLWTHTSFKKNDTSVKSVCRVWYPYPADKLWEILTDTNLWKEIHSEYTDSRSLRRAEYDKLGQLKPKSVKEFYEIVGENIFPSDLNRIRGGMWTSYVFQRFNLPWPLADRWLAMRVKNDESKRGQGFYRYEYKMNSGNFRELKGYWELVPIRGKKGWTEFRGEYKSDPGVAVPHFLTRSAFRSTMRKNREENSKEIEKRFGLKPSTDL
jgi:hypothetical protein